MQGHCSLFCGLSFYRTRDTCSLLSRVFLHTPTKGHFRKSWMGTDILKTLSWRHLLKDNFKTSACGRKQVISLPKIISRHTEGQLVPWKHGSTPRSEPEWMNFYKKQLAWSTVHHWCLDGWLVQGNWCSIPDMIVLFGSLKCTLMWLWPGGINTTAFQGADVRSLCFCRLSERKMTTSGVPPNEVSPQCLGGPPGISICVWCRVCVPAVPSSTCESLFGQASKKPKKLRLLSNLGPLLRQGRASAKWGPGPQTLVERISIRSERRLPWRYPVSPKAPIIHRRSGSSLMDLNVVFCVMSLTHIWQILNESKPIKAMDWPCVFNPKSTISFHFFRSLVVRQMQILRCLLVHPLTPLLCYLEALLVQQGLQSSMNLAWMGATSAAVPSSKSGGVSSTSWWLEGF